MIYMYTYIYGIEISFIKFDVAIATLNNLLTMAVLKKASKKDSHGKDRLNVLTYAPMYT